MKPPWCRICDSEHWNREPHVFKGDPKPVVEVKKGDPPVVTVTKCNQCVTKDAEIARLRNQIEELSPKAPKRDRAGYMREYRKRRG